MHHAWRQGKVVSALFLDIKGAFPNAVTNCLVHIMKCYWLPPEIISFTKRMLAGRKTKLWFDDYTFNWFSITNRIGQGDPLSMILYIIYDSDLVRTARGKQELTLAFVNNTAFLVIGKTFKETHPQLQPFQTETAVAVLAISLPCSCSCLAWGVICKTIRKPAKTGFWVGPSICTMYVILA